MPDCHRMCNGSQGPLWAGRVPHSARSTPGEEHLKVFLWFTAPGHGRSLKWPAVVVDYSINEEREVHKTELFNDQRWGNADTNETLMFHMVTSFPRAVRPESKPSGAAAAGGLQALHCPTCSQG
ncbi:unnamed protein product [Boreogadus saida]